MRFARFIAAAGLCVPLYANAVGVNDAASDFTLTDFNGNEISLSNFRGSKNVLLVFNRGFF